MRKHVFTDQNTQHVGKKILWAVQIVKDNADSVIELPHFKGLPH